jgi:hypothetical protein
VYGRLPINSHLLSGAYLDLSSDARLVMISFLEWFHNSVGIYIFKPLIAN